MTYIAGKCVEGCQIGTGNGGVPEEWGQRGMECLPGVELATPLEWREEGKRFPHLLQNIPVELLLAVAQELPNHLAAEALALQQEVCHPNGGVWDEASRDQELDPFVRVSGREGQRHGEFA